MAGPNRAQPRGLRSTDMGALLMSSRLRMAVYKPLKYLHFLACGRHAVEPMH
jgi:hypothetical protein